MSYFADSAWTYIAKMVNSLREGPAGRRLLLTVPTLPADATLDLGDTLTRHCLGEELKLIFKIADVVWKGWAEAAIDKARQAHWLDETGSLTSWRNLPADRGTTSLLVLCGADSVTDAGSLADFHRCDMEVIWHSQMNRSFRPWVAAKLKTVGLDAKSEDYREFNRLLVPLLEHGKVDLLEAGNWLARLDLSAASCIRDVQQIILDRLVEFGLPNLSRFPLGRKRASLGSYIARADDFFSYTMFLEARVRDKAVKAINAVREALLSGDDPGFDLEDDAVKRPYQTAELFLGGLERYIAGEDPEERTRLLSCDFITIIDKILKFRLRVETDRQPLHRLSGSPIEVVLHALWRTFREFNHGKDSGDSVVNGIEIRADRFKHDYDSSNGSDEVDATADRTDSAHQYLLRLLGGVDKQVETRLTLSNSEGTGIPVSCTLADEQVACTYARAAEPQLEFSVWLRNQSSSKGFRCRFAWRLPETQSYRLAEGMIRWANEGLDEDHCACRLPVFHVPYFEELLRASDDEETRRVMVHCIRDARAEETRLTNLLSSGWLSTGDQLLPPLKDLANAYADFLRYADQQGLHAALFSLQWTRLRKFYADACRLVLNNPAAQESQMVAMLLRCFLVVQRRGPQGGAAWHTEPFERAAVATVLHPCVLEMLEAQILFLFSCFNAAAEQECRRVDRRRAFAENTWSGYVDLASIQAPVVGLLYNEDLNLDTSVRGAELIHRIGSPPETEATLSTRLLVRYEGAVDDEAVTDTEMFHESRESKLLFRLMADYFRLHPHARDGLALAVFRNEDIQPIVAAVHQYINKLADPKDSRYYVLNEARRKPYAITVSVFSDASDDAGVARWIEQWRERWEAAETDEKLRPYRSCVFSVAHRIVEGRQFQALQRLVDQSFEADIAVVYDFIGAGQGGNRFAEVAPFDATSCTLKFPILGKPCCAVRHPTDSFKRSRVISNRQFTLGTLHSQVMHRLKNQGVQAGKEFVVLGVGDFAPWRGVIDALHRKAEWVICIDPSMDERLVKVTLGDQPREREIIGFGSGVGSHGEANFTISTEQFSLGDVRFRLAESIREVYGGAGWSQEDCQLAAEHLLHHACELSGLSLVRATGVGCYIRDFMAYALIRTMFREDSRALCDNLVSLDAYRHWFDLAESERRPDLLWLTAWLGDDQRICLTARLIECKVAQESNEHLIRARAQITNGLRVLVPAFAPRADGDPAAAEACRPDQRYWWLQLHRLIASKAEIVVASQQGAVLSALERLAEGDFTIAWDAAVFAFWSDNNSADARCTGSWMVDAPGETRAKVVTLGSNFVRLAALGQAEVTKAWDEWWTDIPAAGGNVCDALSDVELPPGDDEDTDTPPWIEPDEKGAEDEDGSQVEPPEPETEYPPNTSTTEGAGADSPSERGECTGPVQQPASEGGAETIVQVEHEAAVPQRILLGRTAGGGKPVHWEFGHPRLANRHMVVFGTSGMGKTYAIQCILCELGRKAQNSLIIDYTDGFVPSKLEDGTKTWLRPEQHFIRQSPLPISPFKAQVSVEAGLTFRDTALTIAKRVAAIFKSVYDLGNQQFPVLIDAITEGVQAYGDALTLQQALEILQTYIDDGVHSNGPVRTTISKLKQFVLSNPFAQDKPEIGWSKLFADDVSRCHVFQFHMVDRHSARAIIEFVLWDLYSFVTSSGDKNLPRVVILDEVQNLDLGPDAPVAKYLTEGRKHGLALITATQTVKGVGGVSDERVSRLFQAEHKLFFKPTENEMREHAVLLHNAIGNVSVQDWASRLASLQIGECWSLGRSLDEASGRLVFQAQRIKISALEDRGFNV